jgi:alpha-D-xyloside xylohydrolase
MPVFAREGAILPLQDYRPQGDVTSPDRLTLEAYAGARGAFTLYEDQGDGLAYKSGRSARTRFSQTRAGATTTLTIGAARGSYPGMPPRRVYELRVHGVRRMPARVTLGPRRLAFSYDAARKTVVATTPSIATTRPARVVLSSP